MFFMDNAPLYVKKNTGFLIKQDDNFTPSFIYQPTPEGLITLCEYYSKKYSIELRCIDLRPHVESGDNIHHFFTYLKANSEILDIPEGHIVGLILSHGQHHVVPLLVAKKNGVHYMTSFDSTSGARIPGYFRIAQLFPSTQFYLNAGTRQVDEGSCMTDAICILKEALLNGDIIDLFTKQEILAHDAFKPKQFFTIPKPDHFHLFRMPEQLLLTAQTSRYLIEADVTVTLRGGKTLQAYRDDFLLPVILLNDPERAVTPINGYLYRTGEKHKEILDKLSLSNELLNQIHSEEDDGWSLDNASPYILSRK